MSTTTLSDRAKRTSQIVRQDLREAVQGRRAVDVPTLDARGQQALADLRRDGFAVVPGYWDRDRALAMRDRLATFLEEGRSTDYDNGAYLRFQDDAAYDQGVRRIYHVERLVPELEELRNDRWVRDVTHAYYRMPFHSGVLMYQYNTRSNDNTRYYHVDSFAKEFKSFVYLDDVDEGNGPFTYIKGTHRKHLTRIRKQIAGNKEGAPTSFHPDDVRSLLDDEVQINGPAGTLILTDVRGIHRGSPQLERDRAVLVNYLLQHPGDIFPGRGR